MIKFFTIIFVFILIVIGGLYNTEKNIDLLGFSLTAEWDDGLFQEMVDYKNTQNNSIPYNFIIPDYPKNSSEETQKELEYLISLKQLRSEYKINEIKMEIDLGGMLFGGLPLTHYFNKDVYDFGTEFQNAFLEISTLVLFEKQKFDRTRPHTLNSGIEPIIRVPGHPAYPSGHATQAYFTAYYLSEKYPKNREIYFQDADRIAQNREIAGVHYPSDSQAGRLLAEQYFKIKFHPD